MTKASNYKLNAQAISAGAAAASFPSSGGNDATAFIGLALQITCAYTGTATVGLLVEFLNSGDNSDFDTEAYCSVTLPTGTGTKIATMPIPYAECIRYYRARITGATGTASTVSIEEISVAP